MASSRSVNESTLDLGIKNPVNLLQRNLTSNPRLTIKICKSDAIAAVMQVLTFFFLEDSSTIHCTCTRFVSIVVGNESDDNSYVAHDRGSQNRRFTKRRPRSNRFAKKGSAKKKFWEPLLWCVGPPNNCNYLAAAR